MNELCPDVIVESKENNSELIKAVKYLRDTDSKYIIVYDNSFDNVQLYQEQRILKNYIKSKPNIVLMDIICFEYILLEFDHLIEWIYSPDDEFLAKRADAILARNKLVETIKSGNLNYKIMKEIVEYDKHINNHNIEQLSAKLLYELTRNTGFEVSKGSVGDCWIKSCCEWKGRQDNDVCGLIGNPLSIKDKMRRVYQESSLCTQFSAVGLEVESC